MSDHRLKSVIAAALTCLLVVLSAWSVRIAGAQGLAGNPSVDVDLTSVNANSAGRDMRPPPGPQRPEQAAGAGLRSAAQSRCRVMDPTGTPLNVRTGPNGRIIDTLPNGVLVSVLDVTRDVRGRPWAFIADHETGQSIGWVFREFIACY